MEKAIQYLHWGKPGKGEGNKGIGYDLLSLNEKVAGKERYSEVTVVGKSDVELAYEN